jgi:hypothetical protein
MFEKILIANRGDQSRSDAAAKPNRLMGEAHAGEFSAGGNNV